MKKIISLFMVVLMVFSTAAIPGFAEKSKTTAETELSEISPEIPETVRTKKTKFGKTIYSNPIAIKGTTREWEIYSVRIVKADLLKRYAKTSTAKKLKQKLNLFQVRASTFTLIAPAITTLK